MKDFTNSVRQAEYRARFKKQGLIRVSVWVKPEYSKTIRDIALKYSKTYAVSKNGECIGEYTEYQLIKEMEADSLEDALEILSGHDYTVE